MQPVRTPPVAEPAGLDRRVADGAKMGQEEGAPRTPLGVTLSEIRRQMVASGQPLLDSDGVEREVAERRGGARGPGR